MSAGSRRRLVSIDFQPPASAGTDDFILRMLCVGDLQQDYESVMDGIDKSTGETHIRHVFAENDDWLVYCSDTHSR